jgi:hypothetical protein
MTKIVINSCFGGFGLSDRGFMRYSEIKGINIEYEDRYFALDYLRDNRADPALVQTVEELGKLANTAYSYLTVIEIPDDVEWHIAEYDGLEHVAENHRTWS